MYPGWTLNKGLTIIGADQIIGGLLGPIPVTISVPPGQTAHLVGLAFTLQSPGMGIEFGTRVEVAGGTVFFDTCSFFTRTQSALRIANATVVLDDCPIRATVTSQPALVALGANVTLRDSSVRGADSQCAQFQGCQWTAPAARFDGSNVHAERTTFTGGSHVATGQAGWVSGANAVEAANSRLWLAGCTLLAGSTPHPMPMASGGTALVNSVGVTADLRNTLLIAGPPGGTASSAPVNANAPLVTSALAPAWARGSTSTLTIKGNPNALFGLFMTVAPDIMLVPDVVEPVWSTGAVAVSFGALDAQGVATIPVVVPNVASLQYAPVLCQAVSGTTFPLRASSVTGGTVR